MINEINRNNAAEGVPQDSSVSGTHELKSSSPAPRQGSRGFRYPADTINKVFSELDHGRPRAEIARELGVPVSTIDRWARKHRQQQYPAVPLLEGNGHPDQAPYPRPDVAELSGKDDYDADHTGSPRAAVVPMYTLTPSPSLPLRSHGGEIETMEQNLLAYPPVMARAVSMQFSNKIFYHEAIGWHEFENGKFNTKAEAELVPLVNRTSTEVFSKLALSGRVEDACRCASYFKRAAGLEILRLAAPDLTLSSLSALQHGHDGLLCVPNGMFDLVSGRLIPHDPRYLALTMTGVGYNPMAQCGQWTAIINKLFGDLAPYFQTVLGSALAGHRSRKIIIIQAEDLAAIQSIFGLIKRVKGGYVDIRPLDEAVKIPDYASLKRVLRLRLVLVPSANRDTALENAEIQDFLRIGEMEIQNKKGEVAVIASPPYTIIGATDAQKGFPVLHGDHRSVPQLVEVVPTADRLFDEQLAFLENDAFKQEGEGIHLWLRRGAVMAELPTEHSKPIADATQNMVRIAEAADLDNFIRACIVRESNGNSTRPAFCMAEALYEAYCSYCIERQAIPISQTDFGKMMGQRFRKDRSSAGIIYLQIRLRNDNDPR